MKKQNLPTLFNYRDSFIDSFDRVFDQMVHKQFPTLTDTDSIYIHAHPLLKHMYPNFDELPDKEKDDKLEEVALEYQDLIPNHYNIVAKDIFNIQDDYGLDDNRLKRNLTNLYAL